MNANTPADPETVARVYQSLRLIRRTEEEIASIYPSDKIKSPVHLSIGQEAVAVGVCDALEDTDAVSATYRGHATYLAKGGDPNRMMAELYGKGTGCALGKAGSMHLVDMGHQILGMSAVVGTTIPIGAGYALSFKRRSEKRVVACFFGDGATEEGVFAETLNFASLHKLPVLFVCENNGYAIHSPISNRWATERLTERVETYDIPAKTLENDDVFAIRAEAIDAVAAIRSGAGPRFLECKTYRWREHVGPGEDFDDGYRGRGEFEPWQAADQVKAAGELLDQDARAAIDAEIEAAIAAAVAFAEESPWPADEELMRHVFAD